MTFLGKLFGKKSAPASPTAPTKAPAAAAPGASDPSKDPNMIRVFDRYGRELFMTKQAWRDSVLLGHIQKVWDKPDELAQVIIQSIDDGFAADMLQPAEHLLKTDPDPERASILLAFVYLKLKRLDDADETLRRFIERHGETGAVLTNVAKVQAARGLDSQVLDTLWRGLQLDPNQENGLGWYELLHREKHGPEAGVAALRQVANVPGSWRAKLLLARGALTRRQLEEALALYDQAIALAPRPAPVDMLQQLSGDLGNHGHLPELLRLTEPLFQLEVHGLAVGNNLIKANLDLGQIDAARALVNRLYAQQRMDWKQTLSFWDNELAKASIAVADPVAADKMSVAMINDPAPLWFRATSPAAELFPRPAAASLKIAFLGSTAETVMAAKPTHQMSDGPGRMSRALPLYFAEYVHFHGAAETCTITPWLQGTSPAFVLSGVAWKDDVAAQYARAGEAPADYVVVTHLKARSEPWAVELRLIRTIDARCLGTAQMAFPSVQPENAFRQLAYDLMQLLRTQAELAMFPPPSLYVTPTGGDFAHYLLRLEQLLAVRCATLDQVPATFLSGARDIIDGNLQLCLNQPKNPVARLVLAETVAGMKKALPDVVAEYCVKVRLLQKEKPLPASAHAIVERMLTEVYS